MKQSRWIWALPLLAAALLAGAFFLLPLLEGGEEIEEVHGSYQDRVLASGDCIEENGVTYRLRSNITAILVMGIDPDTEQVSQYDYRHGGQADFLQIIVVDHSRKLVSRLEIDRDTITPVQVLTVMGNDGGHKAMQICLAHGFGDGGEQSCGFTLEAVNTLLGTDIKWYYALSLEGLSVLNDSVGGVEVTLEDDLSSLDPAMTQGATLTLHGKQAEYFVRSRMSVGDGTNVSRMARQRQYLSGLSEKLGVLFQTSESAITGLYESVEPYVVTSLSKGRLINEIWSARAYTVGEAIQIDGVHQTGDDGHMEFYPDEDQLHAAVLEMFYEPL